MWNTFTFFNQLIFSEITPGYDLPVCPNLSKGEPFRISEAGFFYKLECFSCCQSTCQSSEGEKNKCEALKQNSVSTQALP